MKSTLPTHSLYDLSNPHFSSVVIRTKDNTELRGQFVQFKVVKDATFEYLYPAEKFCFLPEEKAEAFWAMHHSRQGEFSDFPTYIRQLGLDDIKHISIEPTMVI